MPTFQKIPKDVKEIGAVGIGHYAVFCKSLSKAVNVATRLSKAEKKGIPGVGYINIKGEKVFYCRYGFVDNPNIYAG